MIVIYGNQNNGQHTHIVIRLYYLSKQMVILLKFDDFYIPWTVLDRTLIIIIRRVTKFLDSLFYFGKYDVDNKNKDYL